MFVSSIKSLST